MGALCPAPSGKEMRRFRGSGRSEGGLGPLFKHGGVGEQLFDSRDGGKRFKSPLRRVTRAQSESPPAKNINTAIPTQLRGKSARLLTGGRKKGRAILLSYKCAF